MKISVVGAGTAGCFTALHFAWYLRNYPEHEVELIYNPEIPPEVVGQASLLDPPRMLWSATSFNWYDNPIHATFKSGILYEGWGKKKDKFFHDFPANSMAMHFCPWEMQEHILKSGQFKVVEDDVSPYDVDSTYVFDCRGTPKDLTDYNNLTSAVNACILARPFFKTVNQHWTRSVATPDGWAFIIPTSEKSPARDGSVGYLYNDKITSKEEAQKNLLEMFDVEVTKHVTFNSYVAKNPIVDGRVFLNGNRLYFLEPMEASSTQGYLQFARTIFNNYLSGENHADKIKKDMLTYIKRSQDFILWHYRHGSKYDTPFWKHASQLAWEPDEAFDEYLEFAMSNSRNDAVPIAYGGNGKPPSKTTFSNDGYAQWSTYAFKNWVDNTSN